eukprot:1150776-Pelagomonas_calceolata.AAC.2
MPAWLHAHAWTKHAPACALCVFCMRACEKAKHLSTCPSGCMDQACACLCVVCVFCMRACEKASTSPPAQVDAWTKHAPACTLCVCFVCMHVKKQSTSPPAQVHAWTKHAPALQAWRGILRLDGCENKSKRWPYHGSMHARPCVSGKD